MTLLYTISLEPVNKLKVTNKKYNWLKLNWLFIKNLLTKIVPILYIFLSFYKLRILEYLEY